MCLCILFVVEPYRQFVVKVVISFCALSAK